MPEREQPNLDRVREALREHDDRQEQTEPPEREPGDDEEAGGEEAGDGP
jgi:hypothetical protein